MKNFLTNLNSLNVPFTLNLASGVEFKNGNASETFRYMNYYNARFDIPYGTTNCSRMFEYCNGFNNYVSIPNTVIDMTNMFRSANNFNYPLDIPVYGYGYRMFAWCESLNCDMNFAYGIHKMDNTFEYCRNLNTTITLPTTVKNLYYTFWGCGNLNKPIRIPSGVEEMCATFGSCYNFNQYLSIPYSVTNMSHTFTGCYNLRQNIQLPSGLINGQATFADCANYDFCPTLPDTLQDASVMFSGCKSLNQNIQIPLNVKHVGGMFSGCTNLDQNIHIPSNVQEVYRMFNGCRNLNQNILIPQNVTSVTDIFYNCDNLYIPHIILGENCNGVTNAFAHTKIRNLTLQKNYYSYSIDMLSIFNTIDGNDFNYNYRFDLSQFRNAKGQFLHPYDYGDILYQIRIPADTIIHSHDIYYRYNNYNLHEFFEPHGYMDNLAPLFGAHYNSRYTRPDEQAQSADQYWNNSWLRNKKRASIFGDPIFAFNSHINSFVAYYVDWENSYHDSDTNENIAPFYTCLLTVY